MKQVALIAVPHEDDELLVAGPVIETLKKKYHCIFAFMTNGDYVFKGDIRVKEAIDSLGVYGVKKEDIVFLGYPDQYTRQDCHFFIDPEAYAASGRSKYTESTAYSQDYSYQITGTHAKLSKESLIQDLVCLIEQWKPALVIGVDYDYHPDHRALSMALDQAMGMVLKKDPTYFPTVWKSYAYAVMWFGKEDFLIMNLPVSFYTDDLGGGNPFLDWKKRCRLPVRQKKLLFQNRLCKALFKHKTQDAFFVTDNVLNSDYAFWTKRTDNLLRTCKLEHSNQEVLRDFSLFQTDDIMQYHPLSSDNLSKTGFYRLGEGEILHFQFDRAYDLENVVVYLVRNHCRNVPILQLRVGQTEILLSSDEEFAKINTEIHQKEIREIEIRNVSGKEVCLAQIEAFEEKPYRFEKIFVEAFSSADPKLYFESGEIPFRVLGYEPLGRRTELMKEEYEIKIIGGGTGVKAEQNLISVGKHVKRFKLCISLKSDPDVTWTAKFIRISVWAKMKRFLIKLINYPTRIILHHLCVTEQKRRMKKYAK